MSGNQASVASETLALSQVAVFEEGQSQEHGYCAIENTIDKGPSEVGQGDVDTGRDAGLDVEVVEDGKHGCDEATEKDDGRQLICNNLRLDEQRC